MSSACKRISTFFQICFGYSHILSCFGVTLVHPSGSIPVLQNATWDVFGFVLLVILVCFVSSFFSVLCANIEEVVDCSNSNLNNRTRTLALPIAIFMSPNFSKRVSIFGGSVFLKCPYTCLFDMPFILSRTFRSYENYSMWCLCDQILCFTNIYTGFRMFVPMK